jgi:arabinan endo-1,5-alpha-L-arabinosidase
MPRRFVYSASLAVCLGFMLLAPTRADVLSTFQVHDPSRMVYSPDDGRWYIFFTGSGTPFMWSTDKVNWNRNNLTDRVWPVGVDDFNYWAPDMWDRPIKGKYYLFYSQSSFGSQTSFIHVASTTSLAAPALWVKEGTAINSVPSGPPRRYNAIDPAVYYDEEADRLWLVFGSFWDGIFIKELNPNDPTQQIDPDTPPIFLAGGRVDPPNAIEGAHVFKRGDWYCLVASVDECCQSGNSTYKQVVGRSLAITGPYVDRDGVDLRTYGGTIFTAGGGPEIGPGQFANYTLDGTDRFTYHFYPGAGGNAARLGGRSIEWDSDDWPLAVFPGPVPEGMYRINRQGTDLYLHARDESTDPAVEGRVEQDVLGSRKSRNWFVFPTTSPGGNTYYNIQNVGTKLWLTIAGGPGDNRRVARHTGTDFVRLEPAKELTTYENQKWRLVAGAAGNAGTVNLMSYRSGLSIGLPNANGGSPAPTTPLLAVVQKPWISSQQASMRFILEPVVDTTAPTFVSIAATPNVVWPPNHRMVPVSVSVSVDDDIDPTPSVRIISIESNEPLVSQDTGNFAPDYEITGELTARVRAERSGLGTGRTYTISVESEDFSGNVSTQTVTVQVPLEI